MYLKRLEMQGFKSFADKTVFEFKNGITAVIGPNGSGKSNISDAIRWVLGEQSMKSLRGTKSEDIIFAGTQNRKSLGFAEVNMIIDNEDNTLPLAYSEVIVTRRIYRSGETGYYINRVPCRLKDIFELFMDTGIGKDGYSIIGQGKIEQILSNKSEDRRHIFEEAAGIVKYRARREESEKKLEQTKVNLIRINDILSEIETNIEPLKLQADKARNFLDLREELKSIEVGLFVFRIETYKQKLEELINNKEIFASQSEDENKKLESMQKLKEELKEKIDTIASEIERLQTLGFESKNQIEKINSDINVSKEKISNNSENKVRLENEIEASNNNIIELEEEKKGKLDKKENLQSNKEKFTKELKEKEEELKTLTQKLSSKELEIEKKKEKLEELKEIKYELQNEITEKDVMAQSLENRKKQSEKDIMQAISELDKKRTEKNGMTSNFTKIEQEKNNNEKALEEEKNKKQQLESKLKEYDLKINNLTDEQRMKRTKYNFLIETEKEKEGYAKSVKELLIACEKDSELKKGVHGVLANIVSTDYKYQIAIEMCLGASLQSIVTQTEEDAKKMIEYLRKNNLGRASFLPISSVHGKKIENISNREGLIGIASDLVKYKKEYEGIILNLLGRTVVVDNMNNAIKIAKDNHYSFRIITLDGDMINPSGAISGGSISKKTANLLGRKEEIKRLEDRIKELEEEIKNIKQEKDKILKEDNASELEQRIQKLQQIEITYATEKEKITQLEQNINSIIERKEKLNQEVINFDKQKLECVTKKQEVETEIVKITENIDLIVEEVEEFAKLNKDDQKYINDLNSDITNLKISVSSFDESSASVEEVVERIEQNIQAEKNAIQTKKEQILLMEEQSKKLSEDILNLEQSIEQIKADVSNSSTKTEELRNAKNLNSERLENVEKDIEKQFEIIQSVKEQLVKIDLKHTSVKEDIEKIVNELWNEYEITPNNAKDYPKPDNVQNTQKRVNELHSKIKDLGSVNVDSIDEYKKTKERYETMCEQRLDLEDAMAKLRNMIGDITNTMKQKFIEKFKQINKNFNEVFFELFGGGKAELVLEDEADILECGIDIRVQPPGKKLKNMMLLSGGERALTAIALLFAILKINPAPFCILDEIEAALDDVNVYRYADYLKKFSSITQFLVITHRKGTMEAADTVYGITMEENGISKLLSIKLKEANK